MAVRKRIILPIPTQYRTRLLRRRFSARSYVLTACCADVLAADVTKQEPDGTLECVMRPAPKLRGANLGVGDKLIIDPASTPHNGDLVQVGEGGLLGIFGKRFKYYPCEEKVLGVIVAHLPREAA